MQPQYNAMTQSVLTFLYSLGVDIENNVEIVKNEHNVEAIKFYEETNGRNYLACIVCDQEVNQYVVNWKYDFIPQNAVNTLAFINELNIQSLGTITYLDANEANPGLVFKKMGTFMEDELLYDDIINCMEHAHSACEKL